MRRNFAQILKDAKIDIKVEYQKLYGMLYDRSIQVSNTNRIGTFDSKVLEQREPYIANETDMAAKALAQEIRNSQALKEMQPEWELFRLENA